MLHGEVGQNLRRVVADRYQFQSLLANLINAPLQLDQLRPAVGSPIRRSYEDEHGSLRSYDRLQCPGLAMLILQAEVGHSLADLRPQCGDIDLRTRRN